MKILLYKYFHLKVIGAHTTPLFSSFLRLWLPSFSRQRQKVNIYVYTYTYNQANQMLDKAFGANDWKLSKLQLHPVKTRRTSAHIYSGWHLVYLILFLCLHFVFLSFSVFLSLSFFFSLGCHYIYIFIPTMYQLDARTL